MTRVAEIIMNVRRMEEIETVPSKKVSLFMPIGG